MANPDVVEALRGERVESTHRGAGAVVDADGQIVFAFGDVERPIFPRSAVKALQALPLVESGAADALSLTDAELALAVASHSGEPEHVALVIGMLAKAGADESDLCCGAHWPIAASAQHALASQGLQPRPCTTTAPASTPAFCALRRRTIGHFRATSNPRIRCSTR